jgi:hypothetical protein
VPDDAYCARASRGRAREALRPTDASEDVAVVTLSVAQECTGLGGEYLLAVDVKTANKYWLGGHGCASTKVLTALPSVFGVVRYMNTSSVLTIPPNVCVSFPGEDPTASLTTPTKVRAVGLFDSRDEAEAFAASVRR